MTVFKIPTESDMIKLGEAWAHAINPGSVLFLCGELGAGKTTLVRGVLAGLGYKAPVTSPTFTLVEHYDLGQGPIYHLDLYRLRDQEELESVGIRDMLSPDAICFIEWPDRAAGLLPAPHYRVDIRYQGNGRRVELTHDDRIKSLT